MEKGLSSGIGKLLLLGIFVIFVYLAFFGFDSEKAYDYTVKQIHEIF